MEKIKVDLDLSYVCDFILECHILWGFFCWSWYIIIICYH